MKRDDNARVFVLMSGGVDSSAAAMLLLRAGWRVAGVTMEHLSSEGWRTAARVCGELGIEHAVIDLAERFEADVIKPFCESYRRGSTPNPCVTCNSAIKFGALWDAIAERHPGEDFYVASGHYARIGWHSGAFTLMRGADRSRDQSYFLCMVSPQRLERLLLPLGEYHKDDVRLIARGAGLAVADKPDSMEICFADEADYRERLAFDSRPGPIYDTSGRKIGEHRGVASFTVGQRKGLGISSRDGLFVVRIDPVENALVVGSREDTQIERVEADGLNVFVPGSIWVGARQTAKVRSQGEPVGCVVESLSEDGVEVRFARRITIPAPGQFLALYDGEILTAGAVIRRAHPV